VPGIVIFRPTALATGSEHDRPSCARDALAVGELSCRFTLINPLSVRKQIEGQIALGLRRHDVPASRCAMGGPSE
jgi:hypothetical protein